MKPNLSKIDLQNQNETSQEIPQSKPWRSAEGIPVKNYFTEADLADAEHLKFAVGLPPYLRGPYSTMYVQNPWTVRQYAGFSTAEESNAFYRKT